MKIVLSSSSGVPLYEQIKTQIRAAVYGGDLQVGDRLPSLRQLAADLRVSLMTVTRAYNDLVADKLVHNEHGRGFVVLEVDTDSARQATRERVEAAATELVAAARGARMSRADVDVILDQFWSTA